MVPPLVVNMANISAGRIRDWPRRMCGITKLALFLWVLASFRSAEGVALALEPGQLVVYEGDVSISCNASGGGNTTWLVNGAPAEDASSGWEVQGGLLVQDNLTVGEHDGSVISCGGVEGYLDVRSVPEIAVGPRSVVVNESLDLILECPVVGGPPLTTRWRRDGALLVPPGPLRVMQLPNGSLLIANASRQDAGEYSCEITWSTSSSKSPPANVTVQYLHLLLQPADQEVVQTHPEAVVVLSCIAEGVPPPTVSLYRKMQQISMVEGVGAMETAVNNTLVIGSPTVDDADLYTCIAQNAFGVVESRPVQVKVTVPLLSKPELSVELTAHSLLANWTSPSDVATRNAINYYIVKVSEQASGQVVANSTKLPRNTSSYEVASLQAFTGYTVRVEVQGLQNAVSNTVNITTRQSVPSGPPRSISVTNITNTSAILKWEEPAIPNGVVTMYQVTVITSLKENTTNTSGTVSELQGLPPHTQVTVTVAAVTSEGVGPAGSTVFRTMEGVPRVAPMRLTVVHKNSTSAALEWKEVSTSDLHGNLTHYTVIIRHDNNELQRLQTNSTRVVVTGLNKFALHHVEVFAETSAGPGPNAFLFLYTETAVPGNGSFVVNLTATPTGPTSVTVRWSPPTDEVYGNITGYLLTWEGAGEKDNVSLTVGQLGDLSSDVLEYNLTALRPFTNYSIQVQATTKHGFGALGHPVFARTEESEPSAPLNVTAEAVNTTVQLSWQPPANLNGMLTHYEFQVEGGGEAKNGSAPANSLNASVTGLDFFTNYTVVVWAWTSRGRGPPGNASFSTEQGPPGAPPSNVSVVAEKRNATVTWGPPPREFWHGIITGYRVIVSNGRSVDANHTTTQLVLGNLTPYTNYTVRVAAVTVQVGNFSDPNYFTTETDAIGDAPQNVTVEMQEDGTSLKVLWQPPTMPNGPLLGYRVSWNGYPYMNVANETTTNNTCYLLMPLSVSTQYRVTVRAYASKYGDGPNSTVEVFTSKTVPGPVTVTQVLTFANEVQLKWAPPTSPVGPLTGYTVSCLGKPQGDSFRQNVSKYTTEHTCGGLAANSTYYVNITAWNKFGSGRAAMKTVDTACKYRTPQVTGVQFDLPVCGSSPSFQYILVVVRELLDDTSLRPLDNYTVSELLAPSWSRRQSDASDTSRPYVTANLTWEGLRSFRFGDGRQYDGFNNKPLRPGAEYDTTLFGERFDKDTVAFAPQKFTAPVEVTNNLVIYIVAGVAAVLALVLLVVICIIAYICVSLCRAEKEDDNFGGFTRRSSFRMSFKKTKLVDPLDQFRATHPWPSLESHPPVPLSGFQSRMTVLQADSNFHFIQEYEGVTVPEEDTYSTEAALSMVNVPKNRYTNIIPYEHSRVKLPSVKGVPGSDYINANYLDGFMRHKAYIATQGPLQKTAEDFWRMVWEQQSAVVVMLTNLMERSKEKCYAYWPEDAGEETYGNIDVRLEEVNALADFTIRTFSLTRAGSQREVRQVKHFQFTAWPDHGVPTYATSMLAFVRRVQAGVQASPDTAGPIVVHCSAGVGRTGTFVVIDSMIRRIRSGIDTLDVFGHVSLLRSQRNFMVQTEDQYFFIYEALSEYVTCGNTELSMEDLEEHMENLGRIVEGEESTYMELEFKHLALEKNDPNRFMSANEPCNKSKNRYINILPFEANRVTLETIRGVEGSDYINASFIDSYQIQGAFIASQAPLENTTEHLWRMVWQYKSPIIVMLTQLTEQGVEQCARYWPVDQPVQFGELQVEPLVGRHTPTYSYREFSLTHSKNDSVHTVRHFHFHCWPEVGVPSTGIPLVELIREVTKMYNQLGSLRPIVVHCSSGVGRTGVFIALNIILERMKLEGVVDVFQTVKMLRIQRPAMVQTLEQYQFCYDTTVEVLSRYDTFKSLLRNTSKARTAHSEVSTFLPTAPTSGANFTGAAGDGQPPQSSPSLDEVA